MAARRKGWFKDLPPVAQTGIVFAGIGGLGYLAWQLHRGAEERERKRRMKEYTDTYCGEVNLSLVANEIYDAMWQYAGGTMEDEERAVSSLLRVSKDCIPALAEVYSKFYGKNLYEDFTNYVQGDLYEQVRPLLNDSDQNTRNARRIMVYHHLFT